MQMAQDGGVLWYQKSPGSAKTLDDSCLTAAFRADRWSTNHRDTCPDDRSMLHCM